MTRIAAVADLHVEALHMGKLLESGKHSALEDQERALDAVVDACVARGVELLIVCGDSTHTNRPSPRALAILGRFFRRLETASIDVIVVAGNHDPDVPAIAEQFRGRVHVATAPTVIKPFGVDIACLPYLPDRYVRSQLAGDASREEIAHALTAAATDILRAFLAQRRPGIPMVLAAHATIAGSTTSTGWSMGFVPGSEWVLPLEELAEFDLVVAGHIHRHQSPAPRIVVPGSLQPLDFSETEAKGFIVAELPNPWRTPWQFVPVPTRAIATWEWDDAKVRQQCSMPAVFNGTAVDILRVRVRCSAETAREFPTSVIAAQLYRAGAFLVQVEVEVEQATRSRDVEMRSALGPVPALERYLEQSATHEPALQDLILKAGHEVVSAHDAQDLGAQVGGLQLRRIELSNFMSLAAADVTFSDEGVVAVTGASGVGKSALICDALRYAIYGNSRYGGKGADRLVRRGARAMSVAVTLAGEDGRELRIVRKLALRPSGSSSSLDVLVREPVAEAEAVMA